MRSAIDSEGRQIHIMSARPQYTELLHPKKVVKCNANDRTAAKQTNEIKIAAPLLDPLNIDGVVITADALLTQRQFACYLVENK